MKQATVMLIVGVVLGSLATGLVALSSASAAGSASTSAAVQATASVPASAPAAAPAAVTAVVVDATPQIESEILPSNFDMGDPILGGKRLGTRPSEVAGALGHAVTSELHASVEGTETNLLNRQQSAELLKIFRSSRGVRRLVHTYGGNPDNAKYYVKEIDANEDLASPCTAWVTAIIRADFASPEGIRGVEMKVYRRKNEAGRLDNTPFVAWTQVSYLDALGGLSRDPGYHPPGASGVSADGLRTVRFKN